MKQIQLYVPAPKNNISLPIIINFIKLLFSSFRSNSTSILKKDRRWVPICSRYKARKLELENSGKQQFEIGTIEIIQKNKKQTMFTTIHSVFFYPRA